MGGCVCMYVYNTNMYIWIDYAYMCILYKGLNTEIIVIDDLDIKVKLRKNNHQCDNQLIS